jgi:hypothetical protein
MGDSVRILVSGSGRAPGTERPRCYAHPRPARRAQPTSRARARSTSSRRRANRRPPGPGSSGEPRARNASAGEGRIGCAITRAARRAAAYAVRNWARTTCNAAAPHVGAAPTVQPLRSRSFGSLASIEGSSSHEPRQPGRGGYRRDRQPRTARVPTGHTADRRSSGSARKRVRIPVRRTEQPRRAQASSEARRKRTGWERLGRRREISRGDRGGRGGRGRISRKGNAQCPQSHPSSDSESTAPGPAGDHGARSLRRPPDVSRRGGRADVHGPEAPSESRRSRAGRR